MNNFAFFVIMTLKLLDVKAALHAVFLLKIYPFPIVGDDAID
jgi:hypothetical protein